MATKITVNTNVRGTDLDGILSAAQQQLDDLDSTVKWTITDVGLWGDMDVASRDGMATLFSASVTATGSK